MCNLFEKKTKKKIQSKDSKDDPRSQKQTGDTD